jgi:tripartite-type tricarboxylate transporter receptor subunit TctC
MRRTAWGQSDPTRPVRLVVGFAAGGASDIAARLIANGSRNGLASTETVVRSPPDGYTLLLVTVANMVNATRHDRINFNFIRDIAPVGAPTRPARDGAESIVPAKTVREFIAYAKARRARPCGIPSWRP